MIGTKRVRWIILLLCLAALFLVTEVILPTLAPAQEEVASYIRRYKDREVSTGFYEQYEVKPRRMAPLVEVPGVTRGMFPYSPTAAKVRTRTRLADSHWGIRFYQRRRCEDCHIRETRASPLPVSATITRPLTPSASTLTSAPNAMRELTPLMPATWCTHPTRPWPPPRRPFPCSSMSSGS
jgi:hypothetical protein